jgi:hypothetical protein
MTRNDANADELPEYEWELWVDPEHPDYRWVRVSGGDLPCPVEIRYGGEPKAGRFVCTGLRVGAPDGAEEWEVSARMLRDIRLGNVLRAIREGLAGGGSDQLTQPFVIGGPTVGQLHGDKAKGLSVRRGRKGLDPETLRRTAEFYRQAVDEGTPQPLAATAARLDVWPSTVWRRLQKAWEQFPELVPRRPKP